MSQRNKVSNEAPMTIGGFWDQNPKFYIFKNSVHLLIETCCIFFSSNVLIAEILKEKCFNILQSGEGEISADRCHRQIKISVALLNFIHAYNMVRLVLKLL